MFVSNGQAHHHWTPDEMRHKTDLKHISDRLFVVVELDELPIKIRTNLFQPDRSRLLDVDDARRLEQQVVEFLNDPEGELMELDRERLREVVAADRNGRPTINIARQIGRALKFRGGFTFNGSGPGKGATKRPRKRRKPDLYADPTAIEGPARRIEVERGRTRMLRFHINARDEFMDSGRGDLRLTCDHPDITERDITIGQLRGGSVRVILAVPEAAALGGCTLTATLSGWQRCAGGIGPDLEWPMELVVVEQRTEEEVEERRRKRREEQQRSERDGNLVGVAFKSEGDFDDWHSGVPGHVDEVEAEILAEEHEEYADLAGLGKTKIPTIFLNRDYAPFKRYQAARAKELKEQGRFRAEERYAVGAGLGLLLLDRDLKAKAEGTPVPSEIELAAKQAAAQSTLVMMPAYDRLAKESGVED
jgi:hypothetical protein